MASLLVIRRRPLDPVPADVFTGNLEGLKITVYEISSDEPTRSETNSKIDRVSSISVRFENSSVKHFASMGNVCVRSMTQTARIGVRHDFTNYY